MNVHQIFYKLKVAWYIYKTPEDYNATSAAV